MPKSTKDISNKKNDVKDLLDKKVEAAQKKIKKSSTSAKAKTSKVSKKATSKKTSSSKSSSQKKKAVSKSKQAASKKRNPAKKVVKEKSKKVDIIEYYDLPYRYNQTVVKILAQTPNTLFVYWDISDEDKNKYVKEFGENFFMDTVPVLIVHNKTMNYSFEIQINDFANSWYFNVNDAKCDYEIELGRRSKPQAPAMNLPNNYMYVASSNIIEAPNNHILFEKNQKVLFFRNVKTNNSFKKDISKFEFMNYIGRIYNIYDVYKKIYKDNELEDLRNNPTSL